MALLDFLVFEGNESVYSEPADYVLVPQSVELLSGKHSVHAWLFAADQPRAVLAQVHGNAENLTSHAPYVAWMAQHGISVLCFDYVGYGRSRGRASTAQCILDTQTALAWGRTYAADHGVPFIVFGQSMGTQMAISAIGEQPHLKHPDLLILEGAFSSMRQMAAHTVNKSLRNPFAADQLARLISERGSAERYIRQLVMPQIFIHSTRDPIVPQPFGLFLFQRSPAQKKIWWSVDADDHLQTFAERNASNRVRLLDKIDALFKQMQGVSL